MGLTALCAAAAFASAGMDLPDDLDALSLEQLSQLRVVTPNRRWEPLFYQPASVFVITSSDIRRTGVRSLPEALRLAPGVEVARDGVDSWSVTMRGFNNDLSNKLLVLIDGRTVYSPLFAGVFWDVQNVMIEDIDRIEVIGGPAGTLWGANAVNGVINIITRPAVETTGGLVAVAGDDPWNSAAVRYGTELSADRAARVYARWFERDQREHGQAGFRLDGGAGTARYTLQGDVYRGSTRGTFRGDFELGTLPVDEPGSIEVGGHNLLYRWSTEFDGGRDLSVRAFYDHTRRDIPGTFDERRDTWDVEVQGRVPLGARHVLQLGGGARVSDDELVNTPFATFTPSRRSAKTVNAFIQDTITLAPERVLLTVGTKLERNDFTGFEWQPQARLSWRTTPDSLVWAAVSQAVRIPARLETDLTLTAPLAIPDVPFPFYVVVEGNDDFDAEELTAYEVGYRFRAGARWSFDATLFHNEYDRLQVTQGSDPVAFPDAPLPHLIIPARIENGMQGSGRGGTLAVNWSPTPFWRLQLHWSHLDLDLENRPGFSSDAPQVAGNSPQNQYSLRAFADVRHDVSLYAGWRKVDPLPSAGSPGYDTADLSVRWTPGTRVELSLTASNLGGGHVEFGGFEVEPAVTAGLRWRF